jgi:hypothetical protein
MNVCVQWVSSGSRDAAAAMSAATGAWLDGFGPTISALFQQLVEVNG